MLGSTTAVAKSRTVTGKIISSEDGFEISGVTVLLKGITVGVVVDINGGNLRSVLFCRGVLYYMMEERNLNRTNAEAALSRLEQTNFSEGNGQNTAWSKPWVIQGTGKPW